MKLLWVKTSPLHPVNTGGSIRTYQMLRQLRAHHDITFVTLAAPDLGDALRRADEYCDRIVPVAWRGAPRRTEWRFYAQAVANLRSAMPLALERYDVPALGATVRRLVSEYSYDVVVCDFLFPAPQVTGLGGVPSVLFQHNVETLIWERMAQRASGLAKTYFGAQARRMRAWEGRLARQFDHVVVVSRDDARLMQEWFGVADASVVPTGVDAEYYHPQSQPAAACDVTFVGSLDWLPNVDGLLWFLETAWPSVRARVPGARFHIVGRRPTPAVQRAVHGQHDVSLWPDVPDVREHLWRAAVVVVPLRVGGGTRLKIYEALACGKALVATPIGAEGLAVTAGEHLVLAAAPSEFADAVVTLLGDPARRARIEHAGRKLVAESCSWQRAASVFGAACERTARRRQATAV